MRTIGPGIRLEATFILGLLLVVVILATGSEPEEALGRSLASKLGGAAADNTYLPLISCCPINSPFSDDPSAWAMAGANPERTSWTPEEARGYLQPLWYKPFEPYIPQRVQIIAAYDMLYVSTSRGLYALDATTGEERWVYPTDLPLGHSPTIDAGIVYVAGFDHKLHAVNARTGQKLWTFDGARAGFQTNPLVADNAVFVGSRDGAMYAIGAHGTARQGSLIWKFQTEGPILYSAAYQDGTVFFASNDMHAYAVNSGTGTLVWRSRKLPGAGFFSWWPVVYRDRVIFSASENYRDFQQPGGLIGLRNTEREELYPDRLINPRGTFIGEGQAQALPGEWAAGTPVLDASVILDYFQRKPWRRSVVILDRFTGEERETAPILWTGTHSGSRYPPVVGVDGLLYQQNSYLSDPWISGGQVTGWQLGSPYITIVSSDWTAVDEPLAYSAGGRLVYWNLCCDREAGGYDITLPNSVILNDAFNRGYSSAPRDDSREWAYFGYDLHNLIPGYNVRYYNPDPNYNNTAASFAGPNGVYGFHGDTNPPIPYKGRLYMHRSNAVIAFAPAPVSPAALPMAITAPAAPTVLPFSVSSLESELAAEVQAVVDAGHLRPGYFSNGVFDSDNAYNFCGDDLADYWHNPAETLYTLLMALPHLPPNLQAQVRAYLQREFSQYPPYEYNHVGWRDGVGREWADLPPEVVGDLVNYPPETENTTFKYPDVIGVRESGIWGRNPFTFYVLWKYAQEFGGAQTIYQASQGRLSSIPPDDILTTMPSVHNAFIAGYLGYLELERMAGRPESSAIRQEYNRLLQLRASTFTEDSAYGQEYQILRYCRTLNAAGNFMFLVPELADYLRQNALPRVQAALNHYDEIAPYWFVSFAAEGFEENALVPLYDAHALFTARALILEAPANELIKYVDVPAFQRGDLYYIQKLAVTIESAQ